MSTKHTPGPWETVKSSLHTDAQNLRQDIVSHGAEFGPAFVAGDILPADASLIAAAPEILQALEKAIERQGFTNEELIDARAVIAKAKGQQ